MSTITTHILDTVLGKPAAEIAVRIDKLEDGRWVEVAASVTDADGRCSDLAADSQPGDYRLTFDTNSYFKRLGRTSIYAEIAITFKCDGKGHYHLPLLLSDNSYTTYRGS